MPALAGPRMAPVVARQQAVARPDDRGGGGLALHVENANPSRRVHSNGVMGTRPAATEAARQAPNEIRLSGFEAVLGLGTDDDRLSGAVGKPGQDVGGADYVKAALGFRIGQGGRTAHLGRRGTKACCST